IQLAERKNKYSKSFKVPLYLRTANSYDGKGSHRIFIPYFQLLIQIIIKYQSFDISKKYPKAQ
ncbi:MAG: hypothetical protein U0L86_01630, partial [Alistipes finegoldii]|nr:hypothetical protein [Alistipes finegoldii]